MSRAVLPGLLLCVLALVGCASVAQLSALQVELASAGYEDASVEHHTINGQDVLSIVVVTAGTSSGDDEDADRVAGLVWRTYAAEVDELRVMVNGRLALEATGDELLERFGERPEALFAPGGDRETPVFAIAVVVVVGLLLAGLVFLVWWRGRRPPPYTPPPGNPAMPNPYQYRPPAPPGP